MNEVADIEQGDNPVEIETGSVKDSADAQSTDEATDSVDSKELNR